MAFSEAFDLFKFLGTISKRDQLAYDKLTPEAKKAAAPFVIQRWLTGTADAAQIVRINTFANPYMFSLGTEKSLLFKLLAAATTGSSPRVSWVKGPGSKSDKLSLEVIREYYECSTREAASYVIDVPSLIEMAEELGWDEDQIKKLKKEIS